LECYEEFQRFTAAHLKRIEELGTLADLWE
jgi:hypothetical protein